MNKLIAITLMLGVSSAHAFSKAHIYPGPYEKTREARQTQREVDADNDSYNYSINPPHGKLND